MTTDQTPASAKNPRTARVLMFDVSLTWANFWYDAFNVILFAGAFAVAVGTYGSIKMGAVKERFSDERTAALETQTEQARAALGTAQADIATAHVKIAEANAREKDAELKLEQLRKHLSARHIHTDRFLELLKDRPKQPVEIMFVKDDGEAFGLAIEIRSALHQAGWDVSEPAPIPPTATARHANLPSAIGAGGQPSGVSVVARAIGQEDFKMMDRGHNSAFLALSDALGDSLGHVAGGINSDASPEYGKLRVVVGPKINPN